MPAADDVDAAVADLADGVVLDPVAAAERRHRADVGVVTHRVDAGVGGGKLALCLFEKPLGHSQLAQGRQVVSRLGHDPVQVRLGAHRFDTGPQ